MKIFIGLLVVAASIQPLVSCDLCAVYSASQARGEIGNGAFGGVAEQFTHFGTVQVDGREIADPSHQYLDSSISQVYAGYNFDKRFAVQFNLPVIYRAFRRPDGAGGIEHGVESGIGDVSLLGTYTPYRKLADHYSLTWNLLGGVKFPTGSSRRIEEEFNEVEDPIGPPSGIHGHDLTLGTGSYDGIVGTGFYGRWRRGFATANVQYAIRSTGDFDYRFANDLTWQAGPGYYFALEDNYTVAVQALASGEYKGKDTFQGETAEDTGVTAVYLGPQVDLTWHESLSAFLAVDLPVTIQNTSLQTVPDYRVRAGISLRF